MLRVLFIAVAVYLIFKWVMGIFRIRGGNMSSKRKPNHASGKDYISRITDQEIDDVDFEEVDSEKEK